MNNLSRLRRGALVVVVWLGVATSVSAATLKLAWDANSELDIAGYILAYGTRPGTYTNQIDVGNVTGYDVTGLSGGVTYFFSVIAYNTSGLKSANSAEVYGQALGLSPTISGWTVWARSASCAADVQPTTEGDFDGDRCADPALFNTSTGNWFIRGWNVAYNWGLSSDKPVPADYDGDGRTDIAVFRPSNGTWYILQSSTQFGSSTWRNWGLSSDKTVPGDYDGDGRADLAVFRPSTGAWWVLQSSASYSASFVRNWGLSTDKPVPADYDGDGRTDLAVYRPSNGTWYVLQSSAQYGTSVVRSWGLSSDVPVPGDYDGDGRADFAVFRPSNGTWYILYSSTNFGTASSLSWGVSTDVPIPADYDGDGRTDIAVYRPSTGTWFVRNVYTLEWGALNSVPALKPVF